MQYVPVFMCVAPSPAYTPWTGDREENYNCNFCAKKKKQLPSVKKFKQNISLEKKNQTPCNNINLKPDKQTNLVKGWEILLVLLMTL